MGEMSKEEIEQTRRFDAKRPVVSGVGCGVPNHQGLQNIAVLGCL